MTRRMKLGDFCSFLNGGTPSKAVPAYFEGDIPWITGADITGPIVTQARSHITEQAIDESATNRVPTGTILLVTRTSVGKVGIAGADLCFSQDITAVLPNPAQADTGFLVHFLRTKQPHFEDSARGATIKGITRQVVADLELPLPPIEEQKRIAALLDKADALRRKRQEALRLTDDFLRATFLDLFGDPEKHGWQMETVEDMLAARPNAIRTGPFGSQLLHSEFVNSGIAVLGIDNAVQNEFRWGKPRFISEEKYEQLRRYTVHPGDVIITIMGTVGRCAIVPADIPTAINTKHLCCLTLDRAKCLPEFLHTYFLTHPIARRYLGQSAKGAIMDGLNMGLIKALPVPKVPLHLQQRFSDIVKQVQKTALRSAKACQETETLFSALQQRAFSGQL